jgi:precorrin-6x reductase
VTKVSKVAEGVVEKVMAAHTLGLTTLMIRRSEPAVLPLVSTLEAAVHTCQELLSS